MNRVLTQRHLVIGLLLLPCFATVSVSAAENDSAFVSIFDGESLEGWTVMPDHAKKAWSVRDGMIVGTGSAKRSYLVYDNHDIADFEMTLSYRLPGEGNSGVSIRAQIDETGTRGFKSYHADFGHLGIGRNILGAWDFHTPGRKEHGCFRGNRLVIDRNDKPTITAIAGALTTADIRKGDWNDVRIVAQDNHFQYWINGKPASEFTEHLPEERRLKSGMIQLQLHDPRMVVHFKNVRLKILK